MGNQYVRPRPIEAFVQKSPVLTTHLMKSTFIRTTPKQVTTANIISRTFRVERLVLSIRHTCILDWQKIFLYFSNNRRITIKQEVGKISVSNLNTVESRLRTARFATSKPLYLH